MLFTRMLARKIIIGVIIIIGLSVAMGFVGKRLPGGFMPEEDMGYLFVNIQLPDAASLQRSNVVAKKLENIIAKHKEVAFVTAAAGYSLLSNAMIPNSGFLFISLKDWDDRELTALEVAAKLNREFRDTVNEAQVFAFGPPAIPGLGSGSGFTMMLQDRGGNSPDYISKQAARFIGEAIQQPEIGSAFTTIPRQYTSALHGGQQG